jgi:hypothetical protein
MNQGNSKQFFVGYHMKNDLVGLFGQLEADTFGLGGLCAPTVVCQSNQTRFAILQIENDNAGLQVWLQGWVGDDGRFWDRPREGAVPMLDVQLRDGQLLARNPQALPASWQQQPHNLMMA